MASRGYNELKYYVSNESLGYVLDVLNTLYGGTDPFPIGSVESLYYDSVDARLYSQCLNGEARKIKFRIRGYGDGTYLQAHLKQKDVFGVRKIKAKLIPVRESPEWLTLAPEQGEEQSLSTILACSHSLGPLRPVVRIRYKRYRFRVKDYRMTLDTQIEAFGVGNEQERYHHMLVPHHVLELKTYESNPRLPLLGLKSLPQISCSKFYLGINLLTKGTLD